MQYIRHCNWNKDNMLQYPTRTLKYSVSGKNLHDDVPDVFSNFALRMKRGNRVKKTVIMSSPI